MLLEWHQARYPLKRLDDLINTLLKLGGEMYHEDSKTEWSKEISRRQEEFQNVVHIENDIQVSDTSLPCQWEVSVSGVSGFVTATGNITSSPVPGPLDYHCTCADLLPLCAHVLTVHALQLRNVSDILVPEPVSLCDTNEKLPVVLTDNQEVIFIDVYLNDNKNTATAESENADAVRFIPDVKSLASTKSTVFPEIEENNVCFEVVIETSDSVQ